MTISDKIKVFEPSKALKKNGASITTSSGAGGNYVLSMNKTVAWHSVGSDDSTTETLTITLPFAVDINRIFLIKHNFKSFKIQYDTNSEFTNVYGLTGVLKPDVILNGDFSNWTGDDPDDWSILGTEDFNTFVTEDINGAKFVTAGNLIGLEQNILTIGKEYTIKIVVHSVTTGSLKVGDNLSVDNIFNQISTAGTYETTFTATSTDLKIARFAGGLPNEFIITSLELTTNLLKEDDFSLNTAYYEFDLVNTDTIKIIVNKTQTPDAEKSLSIFIATEEISTFAGYPKRSSISHDPNNRASQVENGKYIIQRGFDSFSCSLEVQYTIEEDINLIDQLFTRNQPFLLWICGGSTEQFKVVQRGWRLEDVYQVQAVGSLKANYRSDVTKLSPITGLSFVEVV